MTDSPALFNKKYTHSKEALFKGLEEKLSGYNLEIFEASEDGYLVSKDDETMSGWVNNVYTVHEDDRVENIMLFDTETSHLGGYVISFAGILYSLSQKKILKKFYAEINPGVKIDPEATAKSHGMTDQDVADCPSFDSIADKVVDALNWADVLVAHNPLYDIEILMLEFSRLKREIKIPPYLDTMRRLKHLVKAKNSAGHLKDPKLEEAADFFNIPQDKSKLHNALYDTEILTEVFIKSLDL